MESEVMEKSMKSCELAMPVKSYADTADVVVTISGDGNPIGKNVNHEVMSGATNSAGGASPERPSSLAKPVPARCPSPEISGLCPSSNKPPRPPTGNEGFIRRRLLNRSVYSKPKSRFEEQPYEVDPSMFEEDNGLFLKEQFGSGSPYGGSFRRSSPNNKSNHLARSNSLSFIPKTAITASTGLVGGEEDDEEIYKKVTLELSKAKSKKFRTKASIEWIVFFALLGCLVASLTNDRLERATLWEVELWKWCLLVLVIFSGLFLTCWVAHFVVFLIEKNFLLRKKVLYFVHGLKKSVQVFVWLVLILITWELLFNLGVGRSKVVTRILNYVTWTLVSLLIGSFLWFLKTLLLKILASNFHVTTFFDRIQESIFHHYVLQTLSGRPLIEEGERVAREPSTGHFSFRTFKKNKAGKEKKVIDMGKVHRMKQEKVSAWTMKMLVDAVMNTGLLTISNTLEESVDNGGGEQWDKEITNEMEAMAAAYHIFKNVAQPSSKYFDEDDLARFMIKEEVELVFPLFEGSETGRVDIKSLTNWVVKVYQGRKALAHALTDTKTAVKQLNKLVTAILVVVTIVIWLLLVEIATTKLLVLFSSQLVVAAFIFGNTCKMIFEAIIFVFVLHPFDVGDRCVIDGVQLMVEEMNILSTVFLKLDKEKVYYPNSVLATKAISNYYRSPNMGDKIEFTIDFRTPMEKIGLLKENLKKYLEKNTLHWQPNHSIFVTEIENVNKMKMALICNHTMNFQDFLEKNRRRTELVLELKRILEELEIRYYLLPQEIHLGKDESDDPEQAGNDDLRTRAKLLAELQMIHLRQMT